MRVLVTNAASRVAYVVTRSLSANCIPVYTTDWRPYAMCRYSRFVRDHTVCPSPYSQPQAFLDHIVEFSGRNKIELLIPCHEETLLIAKYRDQLPAHVKIVLPSYDQLLFAHDKQRWHNHALHLNILVPPIYSPVELRRKLPELSRADFPMLIKPRQGGGGWAVTQVDSAAALKEHLHHSLFCGHPWERFIIQKKIIGRVHCVAMLFNRGSLRAMVSYKQLRCYPRSRGQATWRISNHHEAAEHYLRLLLEDLSWHGVCQADFIVEEKTNRPYLIDINPRLWGSLFQAIQSGVDIPHLIFQIAQHGDVSPIFHFVEGVQTHWMGGEIAAFLTEIRNKDAESNPLEYIRSLLANYRSDDFCYQDPAPFFAWLWGQFTKSFRKLRVNSPDTDSLKDIWT